MFVDLNFSIRFIIVLKCRKIMKKEQFCSRRAQTEEFSLSFVKLSPKFQKTYVNNEFFYQNHCLAIQQKIEQV